MPSFGDDEVRGAALAKVQHLRELHAGRIPRAALMEGVVLHGERIPLKCGWVYPPPGGLSSTRAFKRNLPTVGSFV
jgi:hypothetical protein